MAAPTGISLAFGNNTLEPAPTWTRIDDTTAFPGVRVASYQIDRGRPSETQKTGGGTATVTLTDQHGALDPTNPTGPFTTPTQKIQPLVQAAICRWNPVDLVWDTRFRGWIADYDYSFDPSQQVNQLTLSLVDIFEILQTIELQPGEAGDDPTGTGAQIIYNLLPTAHDRITQILGVDAGIPAAMYVVFSLNVNVQVTSYSPGDTALQAVQEAVDAEFPDVANAYTDRLGRFAVHGRYAKFNPGGVIAGPPPIDNATWDWHHWYAGDGAFVNLNPATHAQIRQFAFNRGTGYIINTATAYPGYTATGVQVTDAQIKAQLVKDTSSRTLYGIRSWSAPNLITWTSLKDGASALVETKRFAQYAIANYAQARNRITTLGFRPLDPTDPRAGAVHRLLGRVDISDQVDVTVASPGGGGFSAAPFFVEGLHEQVTGRLHSGVAAGGEGYDDVTLTLDVSPGPIDTSMFPP